MAIVAVNIHSSSERPNILQFKPAILPTVNSTGDYIYLLKGIYITHTRQNATPGLTELLDLKGD